MLIEQAIEAIDEVRDLVSVEAYCAITERLKELPSAEPQIIRCKDCKHYHKFIATLSNTSQMVWNEYCGKFRGSVTADDFCSWAERRKEE